MKSVIKILPERKEYCILIKSAFSADFCETMINQKKKTFRTAKMHYPISYHSSDDFYSKTKN